MNKVEEEVMQAKIFVMYREYFDMAEKNRRWSIREDVPWDQCNRSLNPVIADIVETFCSVELFLPDYVSKLIPQVRENRGRAWFLANWGYEESKHSLVLGDWLLRSGQRSDEQMADLEARLWREAVWDPPYDNSLGMLCYTMMQEHATFLHYRNLRRAVVDAGGDPALEKVLMLVGVDERAHFDFFKRLMKLYLEYDRAATLEQIRVVVNTFKMPLYHMMSDGSQRAAQIQDLKIFNEEIFYYEIYRPYLAALGLTKADLKPKRKRTSPLTLDEAAVP